MNKNWNKKYKMIDEIVSSVFGGINFNIDVEIGELLSEYKDITYLCDDGAMEVIKEFRKNKKETKKLIVKSLIKKLNRSIK